MYWIPIRSFPNSISLLPLAVSVRGFASAIIVTLILPISNYAAGGPDYVSKPVPVPVPVAPAAKHPNVDSSTVHRLYMDGDFDEAIQILEANLKDTRQYRHTDSVFIFKHLGVMYAAQYETREKGKYYMHRLLQVEPTANILDMYASDMIYMIFKNIKGEYEQNHMLFSEQLKSKDDRGGGRASNEGSSKEPARPSGSKAWVWAGSAAVLVAVGVGAYLMLAEPKTVNKDSVF